MVANFSILGDFKLDLPLQRAIAGRLHVMFDAELLLFFAKTVPLVISLQLLVVAHLAARRFLFEICRTECTLFVANYTQSIFHLLNLIIGGASSS